MASKRVPEPSATKRGRTLDLATPLQLPSRAVDGFRSLFASDGEATPAGECAEARLGSGIEPPAPSADTPPNHLDRAFVFIDVSGFTAYVDRHGEHAALAVLTRFRSITRDVAARRGVRVGKWLGDGVMLVGVDPSVAIAAAAEMLCRFADSGIDIHAGVANGPVLLFEGDDYIGRSVNLAARLCTAAGPGELLASVDAECLPPWVHSAGQLTVQVAGVGDVEGVHQLVVDRAVLEAFLDGTAA